MSDTPYAKLEELILRENLAIEQTNLANERTLLAYIRTAMALLAAGVSSIHFFESLLIEIAGWVFIPIGVSTIVVGVIRYRIMKRRLSNIGAALGTPKIE